MASVASESRAIDRSGLDRAAERDWPVAPRKGRPLLEEARTVARRHWLFLTVLAIGSILRILSSIAYQPGFFGGGDSLGYIDVSEKLRPTGYRPRRRPAPS